MTGRTKCWILMISNTPDVGNTKDLAQLICIAISIDTCAMLAYPESFGNQSMNQ